MYHHNKLDFVVKTCKLFFFKCITEKMLAFMSKVHATGVYWVFSRIIRHILVYFGIFKKNNNQNKLMVMHFYQIHLGKLTRIYIIKQ